MSTRRCCTLVVTMSLLAGCCCPPTSSSGGRAPGRDPSGGTFAFLGGLRCFFGSDEGTSTKDETRRVNDADLSNKPKVEETDHAAALTIR